MERERLGSRLGFIFLSAGCAIGCGNVWKFPWMAGSNGGGAFVLIYIVCLLILGLPALTMEFAIGRAAPGESGEDVPEAGKKGTEMAYPRIFCSCGKCMPDGILHRCYRLDDILFLEIPHR